MNKTDINAAYENASQEVTIFDKLLSSSACLATFIFAVLIVVAAALYTVVNVLLFINPVLVFVFVSWIIIYAFVKACRDEIKDELCNEEDFF